jgi:hypothetical protein
MPARERLPRIKGLGDELDSIIDEWITSLERALNISAESPLEMSSGRHGTSFYLKMGSPLKIAKTDSEGITAMEPGDPPIPGSGMVTLYHMGEGLTEGPVVRCRNVAMGSAPNGPVGPDRWIVVGECDKQYIVVVDICDAPPEL